MWQHFALCVVKGAADLAASKRPDGRRDSANARMKHLEILAALAISTIMSSAVDARGIVKVYEGKVRALDGVDLQIGSGKVFALLGPNGSGKTTLMRILTTQMPPTEGSALVMGHDTVRGGAEIRRLVGYVPQEMSVWTDITGYENMLIYAKIYGIPSEARKKLISEALEGIGLTEVAEKLVRSYSGGMIRRLEIATALLISPKILFLDEPTIGLDPMARKVVWEKLASFKREFGTTVFFNTHYMDEADLYADEIGIISRGKIVRTGTVAELKRSVGGEVLILELESNGIDASILERVRAVESVKEMALGESELSIIADDAETALPGVMRLIDASGIIVRKVSMNAPTLDDVFLKYAGTRLESNSRIVDIAKVRQTIRRG